MLPDVKPKSMIHSPDTDTFEITGATPLNMFRAVRAYEEEHWASTGRLGIRAELFDEEARYDDIRAFAGGIKSVHGEFTMLGMMTVDDGISVDGLARLYQRRSRGVRDSDHETVVDLLMGGGHLAVAVSRMALRGIDVKYSQQREQWQEEDAALKRAIGRAGLSDDIYTRNNIPQHRGGVRGMSYQAAAAARGDWHGHREGSTPSVALKIPGLLT